MSLVCIATMYNGKAKVGYRLYDTVNKVIKDIATKSFMNGLAGGVKVDNVTVEAGSLKFTAGSEERYAKLDVGYNELGYRPLVVLAKNLKDKNYLVVDPMGNEKLMKESEIVYYANKYGVANAKVVDKHIASLSGSFKELNNIVLKRFVLIRYTGRRDALYEPSEAYYYDLKSDRVLSMREMAKEFGYHELLTTQLYSLQGVPSALNRNPNFAPGPSRPWCTWPAPCGSPQPLPRRLLLPQCGQETRAWEGALRTRLEKQEPAGPSRVAGEV